MDLQTARSLSDMNTAFYTRVSASFSSTRQKPWDGWRRVLDVAGIGEGSEVSVLDLACGNLRFVRFLAQEGASVSAWAVDSCDELVEAGYEGCVQMPGVRAVTCHHLDVVGTLLAGEALADHLAAPACDLSVSFGFLHHIALAGHREAILRALAEHTLPGGTIAVSLWQFAHDRRLMAKARPVTGGDEGDYLLGWQGQDGILRYCHSFTEDEVDALAASCTGLAHEVVRFSADGRGGAMNRYLVLRRD